jgi:hypothetical protein
VLVTDEAMGENGVQVPREILRVTGRNVGNVFYNMGTDVDTMGSEEGAA